MVTHMNTNLFGGVTVWGTNILQKGIDKVKEKGYNGENQTRAPEKIVSILTKCRCNVLNRQTKLYIKKGSQPHKRGRVLKYCVPAKKE